MISLTTRRKARQEAFKILFQLEINEQEIEYFPDQFSKQLVEGVREQETVLDKLIEKFLINWSLERLSLVDKTILRIALYEIIYIEDIPYAVSINEALELAHTFSDEEASKFINGILSKIIKEGDIDEYKHH